MTWSAVGWFVVKIIVATAISYGISRLTQPDRPDVEGPRIDELALMDSAYGVPIPIVYGSMRIAGNIFWSSGLKEHKHEEDVGGKGGGGGGTRTTYTYTCSLAIGICEGPIVGVNRIWMDGKLFSNPSKGVDDDLYGIYPPHIKNLPERNVDSLALYTGTEDQEPDPVMESHEGEGNVPGYRGLSYLVFENLRLDDYGNRIPNIEVEVAVGLTEDYYLYDWQQYLPDVGITTGLDWAVTNYGILCGFEDFESSGRGTLEACLLVPSSDGGFEIAWHNDNITGLFNKSVTAAFSPVSQSFYVCAKGFSNSKMYVLNPSNGYVSRTIDLDVVDEVRISYDKYNYWVFRYGYEIKIAILKANAFTSLHEFELEVPDTTADGVVIDPKRINLVGMKDDKILFFVEFNGSDDDICIATFVWDWDAKQVVDVSPEISIPWSGYTSGYSGVLSTTNTNYVSINRFDTFILDGWTSGRIMKTYSFSEGTTDGAQPVDGVVSDLMNRVGLEPSEYDTSELSDDNLIGFSVTKSMSVKEAIKPLMQAYQFDVVEAEGQIKCTTRGKEQVRSFTEDELAAHEQGSDVPAAVEATRSQENELPTKITVKYKDQNSDYQSAAQYAKRVTQDFDNHKIVELPLVLVADDALQIAEKLLATAWAGRSSYSIQLPSENIDLLPGCSIEAAGYRMHIEEISARLPSIIEIQGTSEELSSYVSNAVAVSPEVPEQKPPKAIATTFSVFMNLPGINQVYSKPGFFIAPYTMGVSPLEWNGAVAYKTNDGGDSWVSVNMVSNQTLVANITNTVDSGPVTRWDGNSSIIIKPLNNRVDLLESVSRLSALSGSNTAAIGDEYGDWEIISYVDVEDNGDGTYTLSNLLRGRRGTEDAITANKVSFVLLKSNSIIFIPIDFEEIDTKLDFKVASIGRNIQSIPSKSWTSQGNTITPWNPVYIDGIRNADGDLNIIWIRRSRAEENWVSKDVPMLESQEKYEVDILDSDENIVRTLSTSGEDSDQTGVTYTASQQNDDFGSLQNSVTVKVYQISDTVGRGFPGKAIV